MTNNSTRDKRHFTSIISAIIIATMLVFPAGLIKVSADNVVNDIIADVNGNKVVTINTGSSASVNYKVVATNSPTGDISACDVDATHAATVSINAPSGVTASPSSRSFTTCGTDQSVSFSSNTAGTYSITVSASGGKSGSLYNVGSGSFTLKVISANTAPVVNVPANIDVTTESLTGVVVNYLVTVTDDHDTLTATCNPPSGSTFQSGPTTVNCSATDSGGLTGTGSFTVTVTIHYLTQADCTQLGQVYNSETNACEAESASQLPIFDITTINDVYQEATGPDGAIVEYPLPAAIDFQGNPATVSCDPASGSQFALGPNTVTCTATDFLGGQSDPPATFTVTVGDKTPPTIDQPEDLLAEAESAAGAPVVYDSPTTHDTVDGDGIAGCSPASGETFPLGDTTVTCTATDAAGNDATPVTFNVKVEDTTPPTIDDHANVGPIEATGPGGATATYDAPATHDLVDGDGVASCSPASGETFALGDTTVNCNATDAHDNIANPTSFTVTVQDTTPPAIDAQGDVGPIEATSSAGATATYTSPATHDLVDGDGTANCSPASGSTFALGDTIVTCNASDVAGNAATSTTFNVKVRDTTPPTITITAPTNGATFILNQVVVASFSCSDYFLATCVGPANVDTSSVGPHTYTVTSTDTTGNPASKTVSYNVNYNTNGFTSPLPKASIKAGQTIPVKFVITDANGAKIGTGTHTITVTWTSGTSGGTDELISSSGSANSGNMFRYDSTAQQWIFNSATLKSWAGGTLVIKATLNSGQTILSNVIVTK